MRSDSPRRLRDWIAAERSSLDAVVLDIDGVLIRNRKALPGAVELLSMLRAEKLPFRLLTNDACHSPREKAASLRSAGVEVREEDLFSSGDALRDLAEERGLRGRRFFAMGRLGDPSFAEAAGLDVTRDPDATEGARGVLISETGYDWEPAINSAVNFLIRDPAALLICPNPDIYFPAHDGRIHLSSGAVARFLQEMVEGCGRPCAHLSRQTVRPRLRSDPRAPRARTRAGGDSQAPRAHGGRFPHGGHRGRQCLRLPHRPGPHGPDDSRDAGGVRYQAGLNVTLIGSKPGKA